MPMTPTEQHSIALELVKIARKDYKSKQDDIIDLYLDFLKKLKGIDNNDK